MKAGCYSRLQIVRAWLLLKTLNCEGWLLLKDTDSEGLAVIKGCKL